MEPAEYRFARGVCFAAELNRRLVMCLLECLIVKRICSKV